MLSNDKMAELTRKKNKLLYGPNAKMETHVPLTSAFLGQAITQVQRHENNVPVPPNVPDANERVDGNHK